MQGDLKIEGPVNGKSAVTLEKLIQHDGLSCVGTQDVPCYLVSWVSRPFKVTKANYVTKMYNSTKVTKMGHM